MSGRLKIKQTKSAIGRLRKQRGTIRALGMNRLYQVVEHADTPQIRGMLEKVKHLVEVEEV